MVHMPIHKSLSATVIRYHGIGEVYVGNHLILKLDVSQFISDLYWIPTLYDVACRSESEQEYEFILMVQNALIDGNCVLASVHFIELLLLFNTYTLLVSGIASNA